MTDRAPQSQEKFVVRLPDGMRERLRMIAEANNRSMNAEAVQALSVHIEGEEYQQQLEVARDAWLRDPEYQSEGFPELSARELPATKGDIERLKELIKAMADQLAKPDS